MTARIPFLIAAAATTVLTLTGPADAASSAPQSQSQCRSAWMEPKSQLADECRDRGWVIWERLVVKPTKVVTYYTIPACKTTYPDSEVVLPQRPLPCYVNFGTDGSAGPIYYVDGNGTKHHVKQAD